MAKYVCSVCGYIYDEASGIPEAGIAPGTAWDALPDDWVCPLCGATKDEFSKQDDTEEKAEVKRVHTAEMPTDIKELTRLEISALCTNLARGCEKQYNSEASEQFRTLAAYYKDSAAPAENPDFDVLLALVNKDLEDVFPRVNAIAADAEDRGAKRALVWSEKVTRIINSLLNRYQKEGDAMLESTGVYVCTICGFIYVGDALPDVCPVCKVPNYKFEKIEGR